MTPDEATRQALAEALALEATMREAKDGRVYGPASTLADDWLEHAAAILATEPGSRLTTTDHPDVRAGLALLVEHLDAMSGANSHRLGCRCGGSDDGVHSCRSLLAAIESARAALSATSEPKEVSP
jgi:hypothetical protein